MCKFNEIVKRHGNVAFLFGGKQSMKLFDRQYRFAAGDFEIGGTSPNQPAALRISFSVQKADTETPNTAKISLWNLNPQQLATLNGRDCFTVLRAGYGNHMTLVFTGTVTFIRTHMDGADRETMMEIVDGCVPLRDTYVSLSYSGIVNARPIIDAIAAEMGVAVTYSHNATFADFPNGFAFVGAGRVALDKACATSGLRWQICNGVLQVKMARDTMNRAAYVLSPDSGLLGIPKNIVIAADGEGLDEEPGVEVEYLLNGAIGVSDFVRLESREIQGFFRVKWLELVGDNMQGAWKCTARLIEA